MSKAGKGGIRIGQMEINMDETRRRVEERLETARVYKYLGIVRREVRMTSGTEPRYHGATNRIGKATEAAAVWNADQEERMRTAYEDVERAVGSLPDKQGEIIRLRYLSSLDGEMDFQVCQEVHLSERTYRRVKAKAIVNLALALRLEEWSFAE
ncbi:ArpU family phage packaging/lysis transcriptional regulator [Paenibacillus sp. YN15]|uniref:ArpU family phage packaging/lysis transcriptional regulator n=1 Tax=Paenibacillus sp. YN15 TaxID=1742774 RepID=UPI000DCE1B13|nr:ArpU family phage packaging/lysis transcriptional regulator [Paenibacillus sp. YN15]RAU93205.1 ArpU family transcriptional regulator [Paenibacillus sp. YN15]